ncbi:unknown [Eubacterium sp. CAG:841]|nr:unknown [Eubacterium sp. CAG:841]
MQKNRTDCVLVRLYAFLAHDVKRVGKSAFLYFGDDLLACRFICVSVGKDESLFAAVFFKHCGNICHCTG